MFKVICVKNDTMINNLVSKIEIGSIEEVIEQTHLFSNKRRRLILCYRLKGREATKEPYIAYYAADHFALLNGPDEQELHLRHVEKLTAEYMAKYGEAPIVKLDPVAFAKIWDKVSEAMEKSEKL